MYHSNHLFPTFFLLPTLVQKLKKICVFELNARDSLYHQFVATTIVRHTNLKLVVFILSPCLNLCSNCPRKIFLDTFFLTKENISNYIRFRFLDQNYLLAHFCSFKCFHCCFFGTSNLKCQFKVLNTLICPKINYY